MKIVITSVKRRLQYQSSVVRPRLVSPEDYKEDVNKEFRFGKVIPKS